MRRSSTTVSGPATLLLRRYGAKLLQTAATTPDPGPPAIIRMIPTVLMLNPEALTLIAPGQGRPDPVAGTSSSIRPSSWRISAEGHNPVRSAAGPGRGGVVTLR